MSRGAKLTSPRLAIEIVNAALVAPSGRTCTSIAGSLSVSSRSSLAAERSYERFEYIKLAAEMAIAIIEKTVAACGNLQAIFLPFAFNPSSTSRLLLLDTRVDRVGALLAGCE